MDPADAVLESIDADLNGTTIGLQRRDRRRPVRRAGRPERSRSSPTTSSPSPRFRRAAPPRSATPSRFSLRPAEVGGAPHHRSRAISSPARSPTASVGDYLLANDVARFIIQDAAQRDLYSVGALRREHHRRRAGRPSRPRQLPRDPAGDQHRDRHQRADASRSSTTAPTAAPRSIRTCGPDDVLDFVNPSTIIEDIGGLTFPAAADDNDYDVEGCTEYILEPGKPYVKMVTTIFNNEDVELGFFVGDYINASGELEQWTQRRRGHRRAASSATLGVLELHRLRRGDRRRLRARHHPDPRARRRRARASSPPPASPTSCRATRCIGVVLGAPPTFDVPAQRQQVVHPLLRRRRRQRRQRGRRSRTQVKGLPIGHAARLRHRRRRAGARRARQRRPGRPPARSPASRRPASPTPDGCYARHAAARHVRLRRVRATARRTRAAARRRWSTPITIAAGDAGGAGHRPAGAPATCASTVIDENSDAGAGARQHRRLRSQPRGRDLPSADGTGLFHDQSDSAAVRHHARRLHRRRPATLEFDLEPGSYRVYVSRGAEYSLFEQRAHGRRAGAHGQRRGADRARRRHAPASSPPTTTCTASPAPTRASADSDRVRQFAGEGVDNIIMTDHHPHTDLTPTIARARLHAVRARDHRRGDHDLGLPATTTPTRC